MKTRIIHLYEAVAGLILSLLGFTGCRSLLDIIEPKAEYGMPHATFKLEGQVKDADTGRGIEGLQVVYSRPEYVDENGTQHFYEEHNLTGKDGAINVTLQDYRMDADDISIRVEDIDGDKNGKYATETLPKKDLSVNFVKDNQSTWHLGTYTIAFTAKMMEYSNMVAEYGMPHATYKIVGNVTDTEGAPVPGIEVLARLWGEGYMDEEALPTGYTGADGRFSLQGDAWPGATEVLLECKDVDGEANGGLFADASGKATLEKQAEGNGHWHDGTFGATLDIRLKKAE